MADIDVKVLYLETPPVSAPQSTYILGVRMKNVGIHARTAQGYVRVYDKDSGLLLHTFNVASAEMDPVQEKQAFAGAIWDLSAEEVGKEFIVSGLISCVGDMEPANNVLNPTTVTVTGEAPPPPPAVTPHKEQHEDGGNDEIDVTDLSGVLKTPQPYADHASRHENGGDDELSLTDLSGVAATPQIAADHGNERHVEDFLETSLMTAHMNDETPHAADTTVERKANKGQVDGYPELDGGGKVPAAQLPDMPPAVHGAAKHDASVEETSAKGAANGYAPLDVGSRVPSANLGSNPGDDGKFLNGIQDFATIVDDIVESRPLWAPDVSAGSTAARRGHVHSQGGGLAQTFNDGVPYFGGAVLMLDLLIPGNIAVPPGFNLRDLVFGRIYGNGARPIQLDVYLGPGGGPGDLQIANIPALIPPNSDNTCWRLEGTTLLASAALEASALHCLLLPAGPGVAGSCLDTFGSMPPDWNPVVANHLTVWLTPNGDPVDYMTREGANGFLVLDTNS